MRPLQISNRKDWKNIKDSKISLLLTRHRQTAC